MADIVGQADIRGLNVSKIVTGFALQEYVFKQLCVIEKSTKWQDRYFQETATDLTGHSTDPVEGSPRFAQFPGANVSWTQQNSYMKKHAMETKISWEDGMTNDIDVIARSLLRIARAVAKSVDAEIWDTLTESQSAVNINAVTSTAAWDAGSGQDIIEDISEGIQKIEENNYNPHKNGFLCVNPKDYKSMITWLISTKGASIPMFSSQKVENGKVGEFLGLNILKSNSVTADFSAVIVGKEAGTWKSVQDLQVVSIPDQGIGWTIRAWEIGACQLKNPKAVSLISNTAV